MPDLTFSVYFLLNALVSDSRILLQSPELLPMGSFSYCATTAQPPSVESAILINLFLFFSLEMTTFKGVENETCLSEMLSMMS